MQDKIKIFVDIPVINGYVEKTPAPNFDVTFDLSANVVYFVVQNDTIIRNNTSFVYNAAVGDSPGVIFSALWVHITEQCTLMGWPTPGQMDVFVYVPTALGQIFADIPTFA